jgi:hypothetical protein
MVARPRAALVLFAVLLALPAAGCGADPAPPPGAPSTEAPVAPDPSSPAPAPGEPGGEAQVAVPVYYVAETAAGFRLQREFHRVTTSDPASAAVREMLADPTGNDPDYRTPWPPSATLHAPVVADSGVIEVDLAGVSPAQVGTQVAELAVQQLVFTVQGALQSTDPVRILVDGRPVDELWGAVDVAEPVQRGDPYALRSLVQIDTPSDGAVVGPEVRVTGEAAVFEATVLWEVLRDDAVVQSGFTSTAEGQRFAPYSFTVTLDPGTYTVRVLESDPSNGEGRPVLSDDKTITVR